jgi:hypothetical protein
VAEEFQSVCRFVVLGSGLVLEGSAKLKRVYFDLPLIVTLIESYTLRRMSEEELN